MQIYPSNAHEFRGKTIFTLWDHEENGGYGHYSAEREAIDAAGRIMARVERSIERIPYMLLVAQVPSRVQGYYEDVRCRIELEPAR
jgi:hypothetical protein